MFVSVTKATTDCKFLGLYSPTCPSCLPLVFLHIILMKQNVYKRKKQQRNTVRLSVFQKLLSNPQNKQFKVSSGIIPSAENISPHNMVPYYCKKVPNPSVGSQKWEKSILFILCLLCCVESSEKIVLLWRHKGNSYLCQVSGSTPSKVLTVLETLEDAEK